MGIEPAFYPLSYGETNGEQEGGHGFDSHWEVRFFVPLSWHDDDSFIFLISLLSYKFTIFLYLSYSMQSALLILAVCSRCVTYEPSKWHCSPKCSLICISVVRAPAWFLGGYGFNSCRGEIFSSSHACDVTIMLQIIWQTLLHLSKTQFYIQVNKWLHFSLLPIILADL